MNAPQYNLRPLWDAILVIFDAFRSLCEKNKLRYYMAYGSAIGTVRHHGFIPWDDDFDVWMPREDYEKYLILAREGGLPDFLSVETWWSDPDYRCSFSYIRDVRGCEKARVEKECNLKFRNVYIDVYPLDGTPASYLPFKFWILKNVLLRYAMAAFVKTRDKGRKTWRDCVGEAFSRIYGLKNLDDCKRFHQKWTTSYPFLTSTRSMWTDSAVRKSFPSEVWGDPVMMEFEGRQVPMPHDYDIVLRTLYGDYMQLPPVEKRCPTHPVLD